MKRRGTALVAALLLLSAVNSSGKLYREGERGVRGTAVSSSLVVASYANCAFACSKTPDCRGFNWKSSGGLCDILSSLAAIVADPGCDIYVEEIVRTSLSLSFPCSFCMGTPPTEISYWRLHCPCGSVAVGVASLTALNDLDYLLCSQLPGVTLNYTGGEFIEGYQTCTEVFAGLPFSVTAVWADQQFFAPPTSFRYHCREIISGQQLNLARCVEPSASQGTIPGVPGNGHQVLLCPPHMVAAAMHWDTSASVLKFLCCLLE